MDASSSMSYKWGPTQSRWDVARQAVLSIMDSMYAINNEVEFAVRVYGSEFPAQEKNCFDTKLEIPFNLQNLNQVATRLKYINPTGSSPIAYSLKQSSATELADFALYDYSFILITDGGESCGGDVCDAYKTLIQNKIKVEPYIIGLDTNKNLLNYYECLGQYVSVTKPGDIAMAVKLIVDKNRVLLEKKKILNLKTTFSNTEKLAPPTEIPFVQENNIINFLLSIKPNYTFKSIVRVPPATAITTKKFINFQNIVPPYAGGAVDNLRVISLLNFNLKPIIPKPALLNKYLRNVPMAPIALEPKLSPNELAFLQMLAPKLVNTFYTKKIAKPYVTKQTIILPEVEFKQNEFVLEGINKNNKANLMKLVFKTPKPTTKLLSKIIIPELEFKQEALSIESMVSNLKVNSFKINIKPAVLKVRSTSKTTIPEIPFAKEAETIATITVPYLVKALTVKSKGLVLNKKGLVKLAPIEIGPEPSGAEAEKIAFMWSNQFRLSYMPSKPKPPVRSRLVYRVVNKSIVQIKSKSTVPVKDAPVIFTVEREASAETKVQVFFTDGNGKFYKTKPMVAIIDPATQKNVKVFMRDYYGGEPEAVKLDFDGVYDFAVLGQKDITMKNVTIEKNKLNKIILKVDKGTLIFTYANNRERPVDHTAIVVRRFGKNTDAPIKMSCTEQKLFEPGDYYIELDILPKYGVATEISFGATTEIQLPQEGAMQITNTENIGPVELFYEHGDQFESFKTLRVNGNMDAQKLLLRPGLYKAQFVPAGMPQGYPPIIVDFQVKSNLETALYLKDYKGQMVGPNGTGRPVFIPNDGNIDMKILDKKK